MYKELIISVIILIIIFFCDYITQKYTDNTVNMAVENMNELKGLLFSNEIESQEKINKSVEIYEEWLKHHEILAYFIEHDEIEKIETEFVSCKSFIASGKYELADSELEKAIFILEHINDKYSFSLENIF